MKTVDILKAAVDEKKYVDVGFDACSHFGVTSLELRNAITELRKQGYGIHYTHVTQKNSDKKLLVKILTTPEITYSEVHKLLRNGG